MAAKSNALPWFFFGLALFSVCTLTAVYYTNRAEVLRSKCESQKQFSLARLGFLLQSYLPRSLQPSWTDPDADPKVCEYRTFRLLHHITVHHLPRDAQESWEKILNGTSAIIERVRHGAVALSTQLRDSVTESITDVREITVHVAERVSNSTSAAYKKTADWCSSFAGKLVEKSHLGLDAAIDAFLAFGQLVLGYLLAGLYTAANAVALVWRVIAVLACNVFSGIKHVLNTVLLSITLPLPVRHPWLVKSCWIATFIAIFVTVFVKVARRKRKKKPEETQGDSKPSKQLVLKEGRDDSAAWEHTTPRLQQVESSILALQEALRLSPASLWHLLHGSQPCRCRVRTALRWLGRLVLLTAVLLLVVSVPWEYVRLYQEETARRAAHLLQGPPAECLPAKMSLLASLTAWVRAKFTWEKLDPCQQYFYMLVVDPLWEINPFMALSSVLVRGLVKPLETVGSGMGRSLRSLMHEVPAQWQPLLLLLLAFLLPLALLTACRYRLRLLHLLHLEPRSPKDKESPPSRRPLPPPPAARTSRQQQWRAGLAGLEERVGGREREGGVNSTPLTPPPPLDDSGTGHSVQVGWEKSMDRRMR